MASDKKTEAICAIIGASHAGVNAAFTLRREGWEGTIILFDSDPNLPYHRPPLSKAYLSADDQTQLDLLFPEQNYVSEDIQLQLGKTITGIDSNNKTLSVSDNSIQPYDTLILATGARPLIPPIRGIGSTPNVFPMRCIADAIAIRNALKKVKQKRALIIGGGYIGLETAASLKKLGADVTIIERESRVLARITSPEMSAFFESLHKKNGVALYTDKTVESIKADEGTNLVSCQDGSTFTADIIVFGVGINVNTELAQKAGLKIDNGIVVDQSAKTDNEHIYAIGDCTYHYNPHYERYVRLESVQNAVDQAKIAAASICGNEVKYDAIPWFWSDQYDVKLQMVGLSNGYNEVIERIEENVENCRSLWYFKDDELLAVDAVNNGKAYVLGTRFIQGGQKLDKEKIRNTSIPIKPTSFLVD